MPLKNIEIVVINYVVLAILLKNAAKVRKHVTLTQNNFYENCVQVNNVKLIF